MNYMNLAEFHSLLGDVIKSELYLQKAEDLAKAIKVIHWHEEDKMWYDYDILNSVSKHSIVTITI